MIKKTITYTDYNGTERTEDFYFHLSKPELMELELNTEGGLSNKIKKIIAAQNAPEIIKTFKEVIEKSYGVKTEDGRRFMKSDELFKDFSETEAYSTLYLELATNAEIASAFINGIIPKQK